MAKIDYMVFQDKQFPEDWRVEGNREDGTCEIAIFGGPDAEMRANEYGSFKNRTHPLFNAPKPAAKAKFAQPPPEPSEYTKEKLTVTVQEGREIVLYLSGLRWSYDEKRKTVSARPKSPIERVDKSAPKALGA